MNKSIWIQYTQKPKFESLKQDVDCDVLVIGGGMAGILTAHYLQQSGRHPILVEAKEIGQGITKNTTAVITAQHDTPYNELINLHGEKIAKTYLDANLQAVEEFKNLAVNIDCDFQIKPSYLYSLTNDLIKEQNALHQLGFNSQLTDKTNLPFSVKSAIKFNDMAEFHPLKFLYSLARNLTVYENTFILDIKDNVAFTEKNKIKFQQAVVATHFPFINRTGMFFAKMHQERSYVIALENADNIHGTYTDDTENGYYWRNYNDLLLIGKGDHRVGTDSNAISELEAFAEEFYPQANIKYKWANQDCITLDSIPYIGKYGHLKNVFTSTGFNMWGMTGSMVGAIILKDILNNTFNDYAYAFRTNRSIIRKEFFINLGVTTFNLLRPTAKRCPHLGCALVYNKHEHTWDCQCHGSRFEENGSLIDNPAKKDANI